MSKFREITGPEHGTSRIVVDEVFDEGLETRVIALILDTEVFREWLTQLKLSRQPLVRPKK